ncbi:hypothetical protein L208DRAFT_1301979 [Tricholoma matsutake]|nr:hypothetical protein L208DRAFT_1301979 [Tricholoma matsutake 945]
MLSFDGAQIYRNKISDCWIYVWIIINFSPDLRYKKRYVIPGGIMPGPHKINIVESFKLPGLQHITALNKEGGLSVWDASHNEKVMSRLYIILATADGPGMAYLNGLVGHSGKIGCRLWCGLAGRHKPNKPIYYPVLAKPDNYSVAGCDHDDICPQDVRPIDKDRYMTSLQLVCSARNQSNYEKLHCETGICKPSILSGLPEWTYLGIPTIFPCTLFLTLLTLWWGFGMANLIVRKTPTPLHRGCGLFKKETHGMYMETM